MPNTRSAEKMMRVAERRRLRNRSIKSAVKTFIRKAERSIAEAAEDAQALVVQAQQSLDKAASKGVLHPGNAARRKARLMKKLNTATVAAAESGPAATAAGGTSGRGASGSGKRASSSTSGSKRTATTGRTTTTRRSGPKS